MTISAIFRINIGLQRKSIESFGFSLSAKIQSEAKRISFYSEIWSDSMMLKIDLFLADDILIPEEKNVVLKSIVELKKSSLKFQIHFYYILILYYLI